MIQIENVKVYGLEETIRGMRNPMNSWAKSDSGICGGGDGHIGCQNCSEYDCNHSFDKEFHIGKNDYELMMKLAAAGKPHSKYRRMITVYLDIVAPLYWWKEFDTYKVGTVANSCSTMHKIHEKEFTLEDFSCEHLFNLFNCEASDALFLNKTNVRVDGEDLLGLTINVLNYYRKRYIVTKDKKYWWQMIQLLPSSYNQRRTIMLNYEVLNAIYYYRKYHKLDEWREFCAWIETLPYSELITCNGCEADKTKSTHHIELSGCDDSTGFDMELSESELDLLIKVAEKANQTSTYECMPVIYIDETKPGEKA